MGAWERQLASLWSEKPTMGGHEVVVAMANTKLEYYNFNTAELVCSAIY